MITFLTFIISAWTKYDPTEGSIYWATATIDVLTLFVFDHCYG